MVSRVHYPTLTVTLVCTASTASYTLFCSSGAGNGGQFRSEILTLGVLSGVQIWSGFSITTTALYTASGWVFPAVELCFCVLLFVSQVCLVGAGG